MRVSEAEWNRIMRNLNGGESAAKRSKANKCAEEDKAKTKQLGSDLCQRTQHSWHRPTSSRHGIPLSPGAQMALRLGMGSREASRRGRRRAIGVGVKKRH